MRVFKFFVRIVYQVKIHFFWKFDVFRVRKSLLFLDKAEKMNDCKTLILAPHSDDEWIGCSQIIEKNEDVIICNMDMNGGDSAEMHRLRFQEMQSLATKFNRRLITINCNDREQDLLRVIESFRPEIIFLPFFIDWHEEHIQVMNMLKNVSNSKKDFLVGMYPVSLPMPSSYITHFNPMSKIELKSKWRIFNGVYKTQFFLPWKRFAANERINGAYVGQYAAELYSVMNLDDWLQKIDHCLLTYEEKSFLKRNLNKISIVRSVVEKKGALHECRVDSFVI